MADDKKPADDYDIEMVASHGVGEMNTSAELRRDLKPHQVFMFSIACAIGTGLVIGSGTALSRGGPASMLIAYLLIGAVVFFVMTALGEMASFAPMKKGFGGYATRMVDPAFGYSESIRTPQCLADETSIIVLRLAGTTSSNMRSPLRRTSPLPASLSGIGRPISTSLSGSQSLQPSSLQSTYEQTCSSSVKFSSEADFRSSSCM